MVRALMNQHQHTGFPRLTLISVAAFAVVQAPFAARAQGVTPPPAAGAKPETAPAAAPKPAEPVAPAKPTEAPAVESGANAAPSSSAAQIAPGQAAPSPAAPPAPPPPPAGAVAPAAAVPATAEPLPPAPAEPKHDEGFGPNDPLAGYTGDTAFLRSADNEFQFMPNGRLQVDGLFYKRETDKMPTPTILIRRARLELAGWVGPWFFYNIAGDFASGPAAGANPVAQTNIATTDDFVGIAPWGNIAMLQVGQYDAPFTLENRTSDKYFDFMERSITVRAFGIPTNKETGAMIHGMTPDKGVYYSVAVINGDGQFFKNADSKFDVMGRAWVAPFAIAGEKSLEDIEVGGSFWLGTRAAGTGLPLAKQSTQGQLVFLDNAWTLPAATMGGADTPVELHQDGDLKAFALEANVPIEHHFGARFEYVHKNQDLAVYNVTAPAKPVTLSAAKLNGSSMYGELWWWAVGDDTILPAPGLQLPSRLKKFETKAPRDGLMVAVRVEHLRETVDIGDALAKDPYSAGPWTVNSFELGVNYWHSRRFRATLNYALNVFDGDASGVTDDLKTKKLGGNDSEHEFMLRLAVAL